MSLLNMQVDSDFLERHFKLITINLFKILDPQKHLCMYHMSILIFRAIKTNIHISVLASNNTRVMY